jgi:hypothetical protein
VEVHVALGLLRGTVEPFDSLQIRKGQREIRRYRVVVPLAKRRSEHEHGAPDTVVSEPETLLYGGDAIGPGSERIDAVHNALHTKAVPVCLDHGDDGHLGTGGVTNPLEVAPHGTTSYLDPRSESLAR